MENGIDRVEDGWDLRPMRGVGVGEVVLGSTVRLHIGPHGIEAHGPAELTAGTEAFPVHAAARLNLDRVTQLLDQVVAEVRADDAGTLNVRFANGWQLDVPAASDGPGWTVALRGRHFLASAPGGGVRTSEQRRN
ncbi:DUF6188 family protein [Streptomyces sp. CBMA156]|uniref:DUF6188 family protein n=1 Tax=Streptomyces sp. CBMA156 TaxID=1930280 RepID=UPI001661CBA4|nr:DUF6188 family protein [Streptomyces sp. CBMA156]MBD0670920.1 hypothetical protein [Streptomyces sp. CBMA156]